MLDTRPAFVYTVFQGIIILCVSEVFSKIITSNCETQVLYLLIELFLLHLSFGPPGKCPFEYDNLQRAGCI